MKKAYVVVIVLLGAMLIYLGTDNIQMHQRLKAIKRNQEAESLEASNNLNLELSVERMVYSLLNESPITNEDIETVFLLLPVMNIQKFDAICLKEGSDHTYEKTIAWAFEHIDLKQEKNVSNLFRMSEQLDGAYAEGYAHYIEVLYKEDRAGFFKSLALSPAYSEGVYSLIAVELYDSVAWKAEKLTLQKLLENSELPFAEKMLIENV